jgi:hypothetical protein
LEVVEIHTKYSAIEYEFVAAMFVALEDLDVNYTKDEVEYQKDDGKWHVRHKHRCSTQTGVAGRIRRTSSIWPRCSRLAMVSCA